MRQLNENLSNEKPLEDKFPDRVTIRDFFVNYERLSRLEPTAPDVEFIAKHAAEMAITIASESRHEKAFLEWAELSPVLLWWGYRTFGAFPYDRGSVDILIEPKEEFQPAYMAILEWLPAPPEEGWFFIDDPMDSFAFTPAGVLSRPTGMLYQSLYDCRQFELGVSRLIVPQVPQELPRPVIDLIEANFDKWPTYDRGVPAHVYDLLTSEIMNIGFTNFSYPW